jgi:hypothetical protein
VRGSLIENRQTPDQDEGCQLNPALLTILQNVLSCKCQTNDYAIFTPKYRPDNSRVILRLGTTRVQSNPARWLVVTGPRHASSGRDRQRRRRRLIFNPCAVWQGPKGNRTVRGCKPLPLKFKRFFPVRGFYRATGRCFDPAIAATPRSEKGYIKRIAKRYFRSCGNAVKTLPQYQYPKGDAALRLREFSTSPGLDGLRGFPSRFAVEGQGGPRLQCLPILIRILAG